jgi:ornithine--oxo-acid transaminase
VTRSDELIALTEQWAAHNYHPLPVVLSGGQGAWVTDVEGRRYLDCLAGYSALNFGHCHPRLVARAHEQLQRLTLTSRAFYTEELALFAEELGALTGTTMCLPMNSGAEAVESAIKVARKWGYRTRGIPEDAATVVVMEGNFHGRTTTIISFSDDKLARDEFGPFTPGFVTTTFGDVEALRAALDENPSTVAILLEPVQGEGGVLIPPDGYLRAVRELCSERGVLMVADEIQSGLARTGETFACDHEGVVPDVYVLGKALGGGIVPLSAVCADASVLGVLTPGSHGSTFGGNPFAAAIGREVVAMLGTGEFQRAARVLGAQLQAGLEELVGHGARAVRVRGFWAGVDVDPTVGTGRDVCHRLLDHGVLAKDAHGATIRLAPPLVATADDVDLLLTALRDVLARRA